MSINTRQTKFVIVTVDDVQYDKRVAGEIGNIRKNFQIIPMRNNERGKLCAKMFANLSDVSNIDGKD